MMILAEGLKGGQLEQEYAVGREPPFREDLSTEVEEYDTRAPGLC
jgi:hypothetical protein